MRRLFTATESPLSRGALRWGERTGRWRRVDRGVYAEGAEEPDAFDIVRARVLAARGVASGRLAALLHGFDGVMTPDDRPLRRRTLPAHRVVMIDGIRCTDGLQTLVDLASDLDDREWEQALESALRKKLTSLANVKQVPEGTPGVVRIRRVLAFRGDGPPTESLLETLMVQLIRRTDLPPPTRQHEVYDEHGSFVARVDLAWPELGLFVELDGQHHAGQPVYDARRETAVIAANGWLPGRFTWHEVTRVPNTTARRLYALAHQARRKVA